MSHDEWKYQNETRNKQLNSNSQAVVYIPPVVCKSFLSGIQTVILINAIELNICFKEGKVQRPCTIDVVHVIMYIV